MKLAYDDYVPTNLDPNLSPIILLHGRLYSKKTWAKLAPAIAENTKRKVYALDTRNHGESPWNDDNLEFQAVTDDLDEFLVDHNIRRAILVGHSMGGKIAITLALQKPEKVEKLVVEDMVVENFSPEAKATVLKILNALRKSLSVITEESDEASAREAVCNFLSKALPTSSEKGCIFTIDELPLRKENGRYSWQANLDALEKMLHGSGPNLSGTYCGPTLFLYGDRSFFDVKNDESVEKYFPKAVKLGFDGAGHLLHHDRPEKFLKEVLDFINV